MNTITVAVDTTSLDDIETKRNIDFLLKVKNFVLLSG